MYFAVVAGHVIWICRHVALLVAAPMHRDPLTVIQDFNNLPRQLHLHPAANILIGNAVEATFNLDMIVNVNLGSFVDGQLKLLSRQRFERWLVHFEKGLPTIALELLERTFVEFGQESVDCFIEVVQAIEGYVSQFGQNPSLSDQHRILHLRFVLWLP